MVERMENNSGTQFVNEIVMNEFTMREIATGIWTYKKGRNKVPIIIYLVVVFAPMVYGAVSGNEEFLLLTGVLLLVGLVCLCIYLGVTAYRGAKKREQLIREMLERYGDDRTLTIRIGENICYSFDTVEKAVAFSDVEKIMELDMYLILLLKNGVILPIWKLGFTVGEWNDFIPYFKQRT